MNSLRHNLSIRVQIDIDQPASNLTNHLGMGDDEFIGWKRELGSLKR